MLELIDSLSLPGDPAKPNEDAFGQGDWAAVVVDGATNLGDALMPGGNDAAWLARFGARRLMAHLGDAKGPRKALRDALADTEKSFLGLRRAEPEDTWQMPSASMMLLSLSDPLRPSLAQAPAMAPAVAALAGERRLEFLWYGDCAALVQTPDGVLTIIGDTLDSKAAEAARAKSAPGDAADGLRRPDVIALLRASRNRINSGGNWRFSPDENAATHAARRVIAAPAGTLVMLATDGLLALVSDYRAYSAADLLDAAAATGLESLGAELRAIEHNDPLGRQYPRFKQSDDATGLLLKVQ